MAQAARTFFPQETDEELGPPVTAVSVTVALAPCDGEIALGTNGTIALTNGVIAPELGEIALDLGPALRQA